MTRQWVIILLAAFALCFSYAGKSRRAREHNLDNADKEIVEAITYAYSLEEELWKNERRLKTKADVIELFRKGFSEEKAQELTDYFWMEGTDENGKRFTMLRAGDPILIVPDTIDVISKSEYRAEALLKFKESEEGPITYQAHTVKVRLKKEDETWKIYEADVFEK